MQSLNGLFSCDEGTYSIIHVLDELNLISSESSLIGNVEDSVISLGVLSVDTSDLYEELISDGIELLFVLWPSELWKLDVHGSSQSCSHVGWAGGDVAEVLGVGKFGLTFDTV